MDGLKQWRTNLYQQIDQSFRGHIEDTALLIDSLGEKEGFLARLASSSDDDGLLMGIDSIQFSTQSTQQDDRELEHLTLQVKDQASWVLDGLNRLLSKEGLEQNTLEW